MGVFRIGQLVGHAEFVHVVCRNVLAVGGIFRQAIVVDFLSECSVECHKGFPFVYGHGRDSAAAPGVLMDKCPSILIHPFWSLSGHFWHISEAGEY